MKPTHVAFLAVFVFAMLAHGPAHAADPQGYPGGHREALGTQFETRAAPIAAVTTPAALTHRQMLLHWSEIAVNASGLDHTPVPPGDPRIFGEQLGPARAS